MWFAVVTKVRSAPSDAMMRTKVTISPKAAATDPPRAKRAANGKSCLVRIDDQGCVL